jgi:hypothetical protein
MSEAVLEILQRIQQLPDDDRLLLEERLAEIAEAEWKREAEVARRIARERGLDHMAIDQAVNDVRYPSWGYFLLSRVLSTDATGNPVAFTDRALDTPALDLRSAPAAGANVLAEMHGDLRPASVLQYDRTNGCYFVHYHGRTDDQNAWLIPAQIKLQNGDDYHAVGNLLVVILFAMIGSVVSVAFYDSRERRRGERPSQALGANREWRMIPDSSMQHGLPNMAFP